MKYNEELSGALIGSLFGIFIVVFVNLWAIERDRKLIDRYFPDTELELSAPMSGMKHSNNYTFF